MRFLLFVAAVFLPSLAFAQMAITTDHGLVTHTVKVGDNASGYIVIHNTGQLDDTLTGWDCTIAAHTQLVDASGKPLTSLAIPAGQTVTLSDKGPHLTLNNNYFVINYGGAVPCRLTFANAGDLGVYLYEPPLPK
jgi:copper(I)-binding protein